ncbi:hypothetical protein TeGR_g5926, partial [Tetraparma gracilis]
MSALSKLIETKFWVCYRISALAPSVCRVTLVTNADMGGSIPLLAQRWSMKRVLGPVAEIQDRFERNAKEVDGELRREFSLPKRELELNEGQKHLVQRCKALETHDDESGWNEIESNSSFVSFAVKNVVVERGKH